MGHISLSSEVGGNTYSLILIKNEDGIILDVLNVLNKEDISGIIEKSLDIIQRMLVRLITFLSHIVCLNFCITF